MAETQTDLTIKTVYLKSVIRMASNYYCFFLFLSLNPKFKTKHKIAQWPLSKFSTDKFIKFLEALS